MKYICDVCEYSTDKRNDWYYHKKSKNHKNCVETNNERIIKVSKNHIKFSDQQVSSEEYNKIMQENLLLNKDVETCKILLKEKDTQIQEKDEQIDYLKNVVDNMQIITKNTTNRQASTLNFVIVNFNQAPALCQLERKEATEIIEKEFSKIHNIKELIQNESFDINSDEESLDSTEIKQKKEKMQEKKEEIYVEKLLSLFKNDKLVEYIKDIIVPLYKEGDPKQQMVWNTDAARLNYVIREIVGKQPEWISDKKGLKVTKYVIKPITELMAEMTKKYSKNYYKNTLECNNSLEEMKEHAEKHHLAIGLIHDLLKGEINANVCQILCPEFHLDKNYMNKYIKYDKLLIKK